MVQVINDPYNGNIFGRLGAGIGKGINEQLPKEIERTRLASGLKQLEQEKNLDPMQFFTRAATLPGASPQLIESLGKLARQRMQAQGLEGFKGQAGREEFPTDILRKQEGQEEGVPASVTTRTPIEATLSPYIPKSFSEIQQRAAELYKTNPGFFQNDPQLAIQAASQEDAQEQARNSALQQQRGNEQNVQSTLTQSLRGQQQALGARVPSNIYSSIEDKAVNAVRSKKDGGEGLTEYEAMKKYGTELDQISRQYSAVDSIGNWSLLGRRPNETLNVIKTLQTDFAKRNDLENFADTLMSKNKLSPEMAYSLAYPVRSNKELSNSLVKLPDLSRKRSLEEGPLGELTRVKETEKFSANLANIIKNDRNASPLSIAQQLKAKGYDPDTWMNYLRKNRESLNLSENQARQLEKSTSFSPVLNDVYLRSFGDLEKLEGAK